PFYILLNRNGVIQNIGSKIIKTNNQIEVGQSFFDFYTFQNPFDFNNFVQSTDSASKRLHFLDSLDQTQRFKFSAKKTGDFIILATSPVINNKYHIRNYNLSLNDFVQHDYVSEYIFLQQTTDRSLKESKSVLDSIREKNEELKKTQEDLDLIARFPAENPNPIIRLDYNFSLTYKNQVSEINFLTDFSFQNDLLHDEELKYELQKLVSENSDSSKFILKRNKRTYNIGIRNIQNRGYINVYASDITFYINQLEDKENEIIGVKNFYEFILNNIPSDIAVFDTSHKYLFVNPNGIANPEIRQFMIGKDDYDYFRFRGLSFEIADRRRELFNSVLQNKETIEWEDDIKDAKGNQKVIIRKLAPIFDSNGNVNYVIGYGIDITQRKIAENKLVTATNRLQLLEKFLDRTTDAIQVSNENGQMIYVNDSAANRLGIAKDEISNYRVEDFEKFFESEEDWKNHVQFLKKEGVFQIESENKNIKTGEITKVEVSMTYEEIDGMGYLIAAARDISERIKAQQEISKLSMVAKNTNNGVIMLDVNRKITWVNEAMVKRSGYSYDDLIGQSPRLFQFEGTDPKTVEIVFEKLVKLEPVTTEILHQSKSGKLYWINLNVQPIFDEKQNHVGYMAVEFDITERKEFEEKIAEQNKSLREITDALDQSSLVSIADTKGKIIRANKKFCEISQFTEDELIGQDHSIINSGYHSKEFWSDVWKTISAGFIWRGEVKNKAKDESYYWVDSIIYPVMNLDGKIIHYLSIRHEITERKIAEEELKIKSVFQDLLMEISSKYINLPIDELDDSINGSLAKLGRFVNVDRVYIFDYNYEKRATSNQFEWCEEGIEPQIDQLQNIPFSEVPIWVETHNRGEEIYVPNVSKLKPGKFKELLEMQDIKSIITLPMMDNGTAKGFVGFDAVRELREFNEDEKNLLRLYANMLVNVSNRTEYIRAIEKNRSEIEKINQDLEKIVQEKTMKNLELAKSITDQEKLVMVGEIASGIAHDLNTPLGAIKSGGESIRYTLEGIFKDTIWQCSADQIKFACGRAAGMNFDLFVGGLQMRKESNQFNEFLTNEFPKIDSEKRKKLADLFVKSRIKMAEKDTIERVINSQNPEIFLNLIYQIQMTRTFVDTIINSGERAANVVQDLKSFIKDPKNSGKSEINLRKNIASVLNIFNYEIQRNSELVFMVDDNLIVDGYEIRLFQLWSNLIKNALESIEETESRGELRIFSKKKENEIIVSIENTGREIPTQIKNRIFEKFFTTKADRNGSGLGLSIVKNVIDEHDAKIAVTSNSDVTCFSVSFKVK
ncbi:MAG: PAS domain S-box protein, partial [Bacteroidota bacterium]